MCSTKALGAVATGGVSLLLDDPVEALTYGSLGLLAKEGAEEIAPSLLGGQSAPAQTAGRQETAIDRIQNPVGQNIITGSGGKQASATLAAEIRRAKSFKDRNAVGTVKNLNTSTLSSSGLQLNT